MAGPRDFSRSLGGMKAAVRGKSFRLVSIGGIAELERMMDRPGGSWTAAFEAHRDAVSVSLFGITEADTRPIEPHPDQFADDGSRWHHAISAAARQRYADAVVRWTAWQAKMADVEEAMQRGRSVRLFAGYGYDVTADAGQELRCLPFVARQFYVAINGILPAARLTLHGGGKRAAQSVEDWGAALAAEAARFRASR